MLGGALAALLLLAPAARAQGDDARYALAGGCYQLRSNALGRVRASGDAFRLRAPQPGQSILCGPKRAFLARATHGGVERAADASPDADWRVDGAKDDFTITLPSAGKALAAS